jgi:hypothetical protein
LPISFSIAARDFSSPGATRVMDTPLRPCAARSADAVDVILRVVGDVVVEHVAHGRNVEAAGRHVARHQDRGLALPESVERRHAGVLVHVAVRAPPH